MQPVTLVILAAGAGKRMKSNLPKVLHTLANETFLNIILDQTSAFKNSNTIVVTSEELESHILFQQSMERFKFSAKRQSNPKGTSDALQIALENTEASDTIIVLAGDGPLITSETLINFHNHFLQRNADVMVMGFETSNAFGYGRLITQNDRLSAIIEQLDINADDDFGSMCNAGIYIMKKSALFCLDKIKANPKSGEYYLPDLVKIASDHHLHVSYFLADESEVLGINTQIQRAAAEEVLQKRLRAAAISNGVFMQAPDTVFLSYDTKIESGANINPYVVFASGVEVKSNATILSFSHLHGCIIDEGSSVGPFARVRPTTYIGKNCKIGNFVEIKASEFKDGSKASHLAYIGDVTIGEASTIGAGTVFCNYDGFKKHRSKVGNNVFIGSKSTIISPVEIGEDAIIGAGSVITEDVPSEALSISRSKQSNYPNKANALRQKKSSNPE